MSIVQCFDGSERLERGRNVNGQRRSGLLTEGLYTRKPSVMMVIGHNANEMLRHASLKFETRKL